jgi:hypothetical protein
MCYHQISASKVTQEKLAFQAPYAIKWTYNVMLFDPTNVPVTFIAITHNLDSVWKETAVLEGLTIGHCINTTIIVNNILNCAKSFSQALKYIVCQPHICKVYRRTLSLKKSHFFPKCLEFFGIGVSPDGYCLAMSKHELLKHWPIPHLVRDVVSFVGLFQFYSKFIPNFEICVDPLH